MPLIVYSENNPTSRLIGHAILAAEDFEEAGRVDGMRHFKFGRIQALELDCDILASEKLDRVIKTDFIVFVCSHKSSKEVASFTVHSEGNWSKEAKMGGRPMELSFAAPTEMLNTLLAIKKDNGTSLPVIYEATHHGPLLKTPSFFVEVGGNKDALESEEYTTMVARAVLDALAEPKSKSEFTPVIGIGGMHYAEKFTRLAFDKSYAFSHIMPKYYINELDMLKQAIERSSAKAEKAIIEWKSLKAAERERVIERLDQLGIDHERA